MRLPQPAAGLCAAVSISRRAIPRSLTVGCLARIDKKIVSIAPVDVFCLATLGMVVSDFSRLSDADSLRGIAQ